MDAVTAVMLVFSVIGALDRIIGNRFGLGKEFEKGLVKTFYTYKKSRFLIQILMKTASSYLKVLNINKKTMIQKSHQY